MGDIKQELIDLVDKIDDPRVLKIIRSYLLGILSGLNSLNFYFFTVHDFY